MAEFILTYGYFAIIGVLILTGSGLPIPEEVIIVAAGVLSSQALLDPWLAFAACLFGALAGDCVMYWIGYHFGRNVVREHPWWAHFVKPEREAQIEQMVAKHGLKVFFLARFLVGIRSPVYLSAGILHIPFRRFFLIDLFCATVIIGFFFGLSYRFGEAITAWIKGAELTITCIVVVAILAAVIFFWRRQRRNLAESDPSEETESEEPTEESA